MVSEVVLWPNGSAIWSAFVFLPQVHQLEDSNATFEKKVAVNRSVLGGNNRDYSPGGQQHSTHVPNSIHNTTLPKKCLLAARGTLPFLCKGSLPCQRWTGV